jgi:RNA polymerase sigma factor (sigma-70 family)
MPSGQDALIGYIRRLAAFPSAGEQSNAALLDRFISERDEQAFTALVKRHGAMVHQVCWRLLGNGAQVEDAFQATFLVLARKAAAVRPREALPAWLHGVARRVALKARSAQSRRQEAGLLSDIPAGGNADPLAEISARELLALIDEEVQRLPERYRLPVILCCLGGRSLEEAAQELGWSFGSVKGRLERGRARLHDRLIRRGLTLSAALAAVELSRATASAAVLVGLAARTIHCALAFGAGNPAVTGASQSAATLASRVGMAMAFPRIALTAALALTLAVLGAGIALHGKTPEPAPPAQEPSPRPELAALPTAPQHSPQPFWDQSDTPVELSGQVLDPRGQPLAGAELYVGCSVRPFVRRILPENPSDEQALPASYPVRATTAGDGRFRFRFATSEIAAQVLDDARPAVMAIAKGFGPQWVEIGPSTSGDFKLQLVEDFPASGRVLDADRRPVAGAKLVVQGIYSAPIDELTRFLKGGSNGWAPRCWKGPLPGNTPSISTDAEGQWRCDGLGRDRIAAFVLEGPQVPRTLLKVATRPGEVAATVFKVHGPAKDYLAPIVRTIRGTVLDQVSREPLAGVTISIRPGNATVRTGSDGRFALVERRQDVGYGLVAHPANGQGYFACQMCAREQPGAAELTQDLLLMRGITLTGRVTNRSTGKPPNFAVLEYYPLLSNQNTRGISCIALVPASTTTVRRDGSYSLPVLPGPGIIGVVASPREDYATANVMGKDWTEFLQQQQALLSQNPSTDYQASIAIALTLGVKGALPIDKYHALALINPPKDAQSQVQDLALQTTQTVHGAVRGPDGQPLLGVQVVGLSAVRMDSEMLESSSFTVTGLLPQGSRELFFQHREKKLGKVVTVRANAAQPIMVNLEPCGTATGRLVDELGIPMPGAYAILSEDASPGSVIAQADNLGRFQMALYPGQKYSWGSLHPLLKNLATVQVEAGQVLDLGDLAQKIQVPRPRPRQPTPGAPR